MMPLPRSALNKKSTGASPRSGKSVRSLGIAEGTRRLSVPGTASNGVEEPGVRRTTLRGGLRVVTEYVPGVRSASVGVWVGVGSRDEQPAVAGAAHFLEHLLFKSTPTRSALEIAQVMDGVGGELNAFTSKESTCFYAHVLDEDLGLAVDLVSDVVLRGRCRTADVDVERQVVLEEISMRDDDPEDLLGDAFIEAMFGNHPLGRPVIGSVESVESMTRTQLHSFHKRRYVPPRMVIAVAGNVDHDQTVALVERSFAGHLDVDTEPAPLRNGAFETRNLPTLSVTNRDSEQSHLCLGVRAFGRYEGHRWALSVLNTAVGGGLSSRLFQEIREERGLAYSVYSSVDTFADTGAFSVYAGCQPENLGEVTTVIRDVLRSVAADGITEEECARAKGSLRGGLVLGLEDSGSRMNRIGRSELNYGNHRGITETLARIDQVTNDQVREVARVLLDRPFGAAVVGPYKSVRSLPSSVKSLVRG